MPESKGAAQIRVTIGLLEFQPLKSALLNGFDVGRRWRGLLRAIVVIKVIVLHCKIPMPAYILRSRRSSNSASVMVTISIGPSMKSAISTAQRIAS